MTFTKSSIRSKSTRGIALPDIAPLAGVLLLVVSYFLLGRFQNPTNEAVATEQLPATTTWHCKFSDNDRVIISLDAKNRLTFSVTSRTIQTAALKAIALHHCIRLTATQATELARIPFLSTDVENLPAYLALPIGERNNANQQHLLGFLSEKELIECLIAAKTSAQTLEHRLIYFTLRIESDVEMINVNHLTDLLQAQGIHRFDLATQFKKLKR